MLNDDIVNACANPRLVARFWSYVDKSGECWVWTSGRFAQGYGSVKVGPGGKAKAHRVSWVLANGRIPDGLHVLHRCDNKPCVNPAHLFIGTNADNVRDRQEKGRSHRPKGTLNGRSKLTVAQVRSIRELAGQKLPRELAEEFGVSRFMVCSIIARRSWAHV